MTEASRVALVTGSARRVGATVINTLHDAGLRCLVHYRRSGDEAEALARRLNDLRPQSAATIRGDLNDDKSLQQVAHDAANAFGRLDFLVNNASSYYPTPLGEVTRAQWDDLMGSNLAAPFFLTQQLADELARNRGAVVNIVDIYAQRPHRDYPVYCAAKAGLANLTRSLAQTLAPNVRVNGVAPGAILWPENDEGEDDRDAIIRSTPLNRLGEPSDIAGAVRYLLLDAGFVSGQILAVDGGRTAGMSLPQ